MSAIILKPSQGEQVYTEAAYIFQQMYEKITGIQLMITETDDETSDLFVIGSDAVNDFVMNEMFEQRLFSLSIRYGTDDYSVRTYRYADRKIVIFAGGRGRSTLYAIYDYFERYAGCHYFWDGDVIPHLDSIPMENVEITESPRFEYRGLRYFAHRGLKRFQAEHWSFEDWKQEINWMVKKRLNFFMLRIGMDDVWQRAFPDDCPYPEDYQTISGIDAEGHDDRSDFWTLRYRGELREKVLEYARLLDLTYPVDCGTMTHWYSRTPKTYLERQKPTFLQQADMQYYSDTGKVFDFRRKEEMSKYMHLTETMVQEYEKKTELFHTIGLGERRMFADKTQNFNLKLFAYRRIAQNIRQKYPNSKLMLASWDFALLWTPQEIQALVRELDPERTIILDYTSECNDPNDSFINWGIVGKFPWIFGLFHAYESESELRGPYERSDERLKIAADDPFCKGMVLWPELSHSDPLILEYLTQNAWAPLQSSIEEITENFCKNRYGGHAGQMNICWQGILPFIKLGDWGGYSRRPEDDEQYAECCPSWYVHRDMWSNLTIALTGTFHDSGLKKYYTYKIAMVTPMLQQIVAVLKQLTDADFSNAFILRDTVDITKTVLSRFMNYIIAKAIMNIENKELIANCKTHYLTLMNVMADVLCQNEDFSIYRTLRSIEKVAPVNPNFEATLKRNINNSYCSQAAYELVTQRFLAEGSLAFDWLLSADKDSVPNFSEQMKEITNHFMDMPLEEMQPAFIPSLKETIMKAASAIDNLSEIFI